jgi:uracil-DNA glycosylase
MEKTAGDSLKKLYERYVNKVKESNSVYDYEFVFSDGQMYKGIMLIGEAPGKDEVEQKNLLSEWQGKTQTVYGQFVAEKRGYIRN